MDFHCFALGVAKSHQVKANVDVGYADFAAGGLTLVTCGIWATAVVLQWART